MVKVMENIPNMEVAWYLNFWVILVVFLSLAMSVGNLIPDDWFTGRRTERVVEKTNTVFWGILIVSSIIFITQIIALGLQLSKYNKANAKWTEDYVSPYLESLPVEKSEIINEMEVESSTKAKVVFNVNGELIIYEPPQKFFSNEEIESFKDIKLRFTLKPEEKPYIEYRYLEEPIERHESGYYNLVLYLPEDYQF